jgi:hypothetical protein
MTGDKICRWRPGDGGSGADPGDAARPFENLTFWTALDILGVAKDFALPIGWKAWKKPHGRTVFEALDEIVEGLAKSRAAEIEAAGVDCPFYDVRRGIAFAVFYAQETVRKEKARRQRRDRVKSGIEKIRHFATSLNELNKLYFDSSSTDGEFRKFAEAAAEALGGKPPVCGRFLPTDAAPMDEFGIGRCNSAEINASLAATRANGDKIRRAVEAAIEAFRPAIEPLKDDVSRLEVESARLKEPSPKRHLFQEGFIQGLGPVWHRLAGRKISITDDGEFREFAEAAAEALGGEPPVRMTKDGKPKKADHILEDRPFRRGVSFMKDLPDWDAVDRYDGTFLEETALDNPRQMGVGRRYWPYPIRQIADDGQKSLPTWLRALISQGR